MKKLAAFVALAVVFSAPAWAAAKTVTLSVSNMTCALCPITVKKALGKVEGVEKTEVNYEKKEAVVTFDDAKTSVEALTKATEGAGYPSELKK
jgi:mercuric ion binding protein